MDELANLKVRQEGLEKLGKRNYSVISGTVRGGLFRDDRLGYFGERVWNEKLGSPKEDLEADIKVFLDGKPPES